MKIAKSLIALKVALKSPRRNGKSIGFVATMGALHEGHCSLIRRARRECETVVVSIYVNPLQFSPGEDLAHYPRDFLADSVAARKAGCDVLFAPGPATLYAKDHSVMVVENYLSSSFCGRYRPGHFLGVCTVVTKLFTLIMPHRAYFGQKDYQQALVIRRIVRDLNLPLAIVVCELKRDRDGLALSSRNRYLNAKQRIRAACLYQCFMEAKTSITKGERSAARIKAKIKKKLQVLANIKVEYLSFVKYNSLTEVGLIRGRVVLLAAVWVDKVRLIDNIIINVKS